MSEVVIEHVTAGVSVIRLSRPASLNALNATMVRALHEAFDEVDARQECRVVILTGEGRGFCSGLDLRGYGDDELVERRGPMLSAFERQRDIANLYLRMVGLRQPIIAAVNGPAAGGGLALVCASDIRIGATSSVFAVSFIRAGYSACDMGVSWLLPRLVGAGRAHELMLTGRRFDAAEAERYGLLVDVVDDERLMDAAMAKADEILLNPPASVELTKVGMWAGVQSTSLAGTVEFENRQQMVAAMTDDAAEATSAFLEKRAPTYRWR
jgi:enoyl-CoA hydratase/carnithine racemase